MTETILRKDKNGIITLRSDFANGGSTIYYKTHTSEVFEHSPFEAADARHDWNKAFSLIRAWLKGQS